jgi:hypothetical protein
MPLDGRIRELCDQASNERDARRLMELVEEIIDEFDSQRVRRTGSSLKATKGGSQGTAATSSQWRDIEE